MKKQIERYTASQRSNHWMVAILFILTGLSGLALFHPALFWLSNLFGGGSWTRILHPFLGVGMFVFFLGLALRFAHHNLWEKRDFQWLRHFHDVLADREDRVPGVGRYNAGQKLLFWTLILCMLALLVTGVVIWREYFSHLFGIDTIRLAAVLHALAAFVLICAIIVHVYAGFWVKGSLRAMTTGWVSRAWVRKHHSAWLEELDKGGH